MTTARTSKQPYIIQGTGMRSVPGSPPASFDLLVWLDPLGDLQEQAAIAACSKGYWSARFTSISPQDTPHDN